MARERIYPILISTSEAASALGVDRKVIYQMYDAGLPRYRIGTKQKILVADLVEFIRHFYKRES